MTSPAPSDHPDSIDVAIAIFGLDDAGKAHASRFDSADAELAEKAAGLMGMRSLRIETAEQRAAAVGLPHGRVFASGRGFVPFVSRAVYERLAALAGPLADRGPVAGDAAEAEGAPAAGHEAEASSTDSGDPGGSPRVPAERSAIRPGSLVLAPERDRASWWPAIVVRPKDEARWVLKWRDFDDPPSIVRKRDEIALMPPAFGA